MSKRCTPRGQCMNCTQSIPSKQFNNKVAQKLQEMLN